MARTKSIDAGLDESNGASSDLGGITQDGRSDSTLDLTLGGLPIADPVELSGDGNDSSSSDSGAGEPAKRRRGRPAGSGNGTQRSTQKDKAVSVTGIEKLLLSTHNLLARLTKVEEMKLDNEEAKMIAEAMANVQQHYSVVVNPKYLAWAGLIGVFVAIYAPRIGVLIVTKKAEKKQGNRVPANNRAPNNVAEMHRPIAPAPFDPSQFSNGNRGAM